MGTQGLWWNDTTTSTFDILFRDFFNTKSTFTSPVDNKISHPVDIFEDNKGLHFEIACTGLSKKDIEIKVEGDVLRVIYIANDKASKDEDARYYHKGIAKRSFNLGYKIARRFDMGTIDAAMNNGLLTITIARTEESQPKVVDIK